MLSPGPRVDLDIIGKFCVEKRVPFFCWVVAGTATTSRSHRSVRLFYLVESQAIFSISKLPPFLKGVNSYWGGGAVGAKGFR
jgi:hypothetical protein